MMPETEDDTILPSIDATVEYKEHLATSYRSKTFAAAFPFGHGLTYTTFEYLEPSVIEAEAFDVAGSSSSAGTLSDPVIAQKRICISCPVRNSGGMAGKAVVQLYLELPPE